MKEDEIIVYVVAAIFLVLIGIGMYSMDTAHTNLREQCTKTNMYVIGNKGHIEQIYKCDEQLQGVQ